MQLASGNKKKSVQQRCASIGNQYSTRMMIPTCNKLYWFWTSSRLLFCSVELFFLSGRYKDVWREPYIWAPDQAVNVIVKVSEKITRLDIFLWVCSCLFGVFFLSVEPISDEVSVSIMKALKRNSALCVTSRPPCLILCERLQQKETLE